MDKYEYKVRADEIKSLIAEGEYGQAADIADMIDWRRVKSVMMLCMVSDLYKVNRRYEDAKNMLKLAYERKPGGRTICYSLCELCIKTEEFVQAVNYYNEFVKAAPKDSGRYILQYKLYEAQNVNLEERIGVLEELKKRDYREKWAYELAYLYHRVGLATRCVEECDELILWFGDGKYVVKAMELKMLHQPLTPSQQDVYDHRFDEYVQEESYSEDAEAQEYEQQEVYSDSGEEALPYEGYGNYESGYAEEQGEAPDLPEELDIQVKTMDVGKYNTINLQKELAAGLQEVLGANGDPGSPEENMAGYGGEEPAGAIPGEMEETEETEVFFGETGEMAGTELESLADREDVSSLVMRQMQEETEAGNRPTDVAVEREPVQEAAGNRPAYVAVEREPVQEAEAGNRPAYGAAEREPVQEAEAGNRPAYDAVEREPVQEAEAGNRPAYDAVERGPAAVENMSTSGDLAEVLSQETDGQIRMILPEKTVVERQITGQMKIEDILAEWERTKKDNEEKCREEVRRHVLRQTGPMFTEFEASVRDGLLARLEEAPGEKPAGREAEGKASAAAGSTEAGTGQQRRAQGRPDYIEKPGDGEEYCTESAEEQPSLNYGEESYAEGAYVKEPDGTEFQGYVEEAYTEESCAESAESGEYQNYEEEGTYIGEYEDAELQGYAEDAYVEGTNVEEAKNREFQDYGEDVYAEGAYAEEPDGTEFQGYVEEAYTEESCVESAESGEYLNYEEEGAYIGEFEDTEFQDYGEDVYAEGTYVEEPEDTEFQGYVEDAYAEGTYVEEPEDAEFQGYVEDAYIEGTNAEESSGEEPAYEEAAGYAEELEDLKDVEFMEADHAEWAEEQEELDYNDPPELTEGGDESEEDRAGEPEEEEQEAPRTEASDYLEVLEQVEELQDQEGKTAREGGKKQKTSSKSSDGTGRDSLEREKAKVRDLTREEKELFAPFIQNRQSREQLVKAIDGISMAAYTGNIVITGEEGMDTMTLAKNMIREVRMTDSNFSGKVARITGEGLSRKNVRETLEGLNNGALIIQKASGMDSNTASMLHMALQQEKFGIIVIIEDTKKAIQKLFLGVPQLFGDFTSRMDLEALSNDTLVSFGRRYAREKEYSIDDLGMLALHTRIEECQTIDHVVTVLEVKQIIDEAIRHANRKTLGHFFDILLARRYDDEDMIILTEKDFVA